MFETRTLPMRRLDRSQSHDIRYVLSDADIDELLACNGWRRAEISSVSGRLEPRDDGWELHARLEGRVTQSCVISDAPVTNRIDLTLRRIYLHQMVEPTADLTLPADLNDDEEAMPQSLDLLELISEVLILELPEYPKLAKYLEDDAFALLDPNDRHADDTQKLNPFAALAALKTDGKAE